MIVVVFALAVSVAESENGEEVVYGSGLNDVEPNGDGFVNHKL